MTTSYRGQVASLFEVLADGLAPLVEERMSRAYPNQDWVLLAAAKLGKRRDVLVSLSDPHFQLEVINRWWGPAFARVLGEDSRQTITDLRTARNRWAHPDEDHPFDFDYALEVHLDAEEVLRTIGSPQADQVARLTEELRWDNIGDVASESGVSATEVLMEQFTSLQRQYDDLQSQLEAARTMAQSAAGRQRAASRQLAELQSQYAAVSGLRDEYLSVQRLVTSEPAGRDANTGALEDPSAMQGHLASSEQTLADLQDRSDRLRGELTVARASIIDVNPVKTAEGQRWIWLVAGLLLMMGLLVAMAASLGAA